MVVLGTKRKASSREIMKAVLGSLVAFVFSCVVLGKGYIFPSHVQV